MTYSNDPTKIKEKIESQIDTCNPLINGDQNLKLYDFKHISCNKQLFTEVEVNSDDYLPTCETTRSLSTTEVNNCFNTYHTETKKISVFLSVD